MSRPRHLTFIASGAAAIVAAIGLVGWYAQTHRTGARIDPAAFRIQDCINLHVVPSANEEIWAIVTHACKEIERHSDSKKAQCVLEIANSVPPFEWLARAEGSCGTSDWTHAG